MGQFSWLDCITGEQIVDDKVRDSYLLIPKEFGGGSHKESCYDGYGHFNGVDAYEAVALWNKNYIDCKNYSSKCLDKPDYDECMKDVPFWELTDDEKKDITNPVVQQKIKDINYKRYQRYMAYYDMEVERLKDFCLGTFSDEELRAKYGSDYLRLIGITIACYDEDNAALKYPIKITHSANAIYEECEPSPGDPDQGWESEDDEYDDYDSYDEDDEE